MALCGVLELSRTCSYEVSSQRDMYRESRNCLVLRLRMVPIVVVVAGYVRRGTVVVKFEVRDGVASSKCSPCAKVCAPLREKAWQHT